MIQRLILFGLYLFISCRGADKVDTPLAMGLPDPRETIAADGVLIPVYSFEGLQPMLHRDDGKTYVVNFWATWCAPCVKELPYFEQISSELGGAGVEVILVSLDMPKMWESHLVPFVRDHKIRSQVVVLDDPKQNDWIPKVAESWSGAIPATLIYTRGRRSFYETPFTYDSLKEELHL